MREVPVYEDVSYFGHNGMTVAYRYFGRDPQKETILFFYGFGGNMNMLEYISECLQKEYSLLVIDYPGHGYSPSNGNFEIGTFVDLCTGLLASLNENEIILLGYSFGGIIGLNFYLKNKALIKKMVLLNSTTCFCPDLITRYFFKFFGLMMKINFGFVIKNIAIPFLRDRYTTMDIVNLGRKVTMMNGKEDVLSYYNSIVYKDFSYLLAEITCPVFVVGSRKDFLIPEKNTHNFSKLISDRTLHIMKDIGHLSIVSKPDSVADLIRTFLNK